jgi:hypothetical protein
MVFRQVCSLKAAADSGFSFPLCFVEKPLTTSLGNRLTPSGSDGSTPLLCA